jgi:hypothetical protein
VRIVFLLFTLFNLLTTTHPVQAEDAVERLAAESEAYVKATVRPESTDPAVLVAKVEEACALLAKEGPAAFPRFKGRNSPFLFQGSYLWVHTLDESRMLMHPIKYRMEGETFAHLKDERGKPFFQVMNQLVRQQGQGWVAYHWPVPGSKTVARKVSFVKRCTRADGVEVVIGAGLHNGDPEAIGRLEIH